MASLAKEQLQFRFFNDAPLSSYICGTCLIQFLILSFFLVDIPKLLYQKFQNYI